MSSRIHIPNKNQHIFICYYRSFTRLPGGSDGKEYTFNAGDLSSISGLGRSLRRAWQTYPALLPENPLRQRSQAGYRNCGLQTVGLPTEPISSTGIIHIQPIPPYPLEYTVGQVFKICQRLYDFYPVFFSVLPNTDFLNQGTGYLA